MRVFWTIFLTVSINALWAQGELKLVRVSDTKTNMGLAYTYLQINDRAYSTDDEGEVFISIQKGDSLCLSRIGYHDTCLVYTGDERLNLALRRHSEILLEAQVFDDRGAHGKRMMEQRVTKLVAYSKDLETRALVLGEEDLLKGLQFLPGVQAGTPGSANIHVRGGSNYQNQILLDNIPVYNVSHLLGSTSPFPSRSIESVSLYKDAIPIDLNGGSSSMITMATPNGIRTKRRGSLGVGFGSLNMDISQPLIKESASIDLAARFSSTGVGTALNTLFNYATGEVNIHSFEDILSNVNWKLPNQNQLKFTFYYSGDAFLSRYSSGFSGNSESRRKFFNRNLAFGLNHKRQVSKRSFINQQVYYTRFTAGEEDSDEYRGNQFNLQTSLSELAYHLQFRHYFSPKRESVLGFKPSITSIQYPQWSLKDTYERKDTSYLGSTYQLFNAATYYQENWQLNDLWSLTAAIRLQLHELKGGKAQALLLPRLSITFNPNSNLGFVLAYDELSQAMHRQRWSNFVGMVDLAFPSSSRFPVERTRQISVSGAWANERVGFSLQGFYRHLSNSHALADHAPPFYFNSFYEQSSDEVLSRPEDYLEQANGYSYGLESGFNAGLGNFTFDLSYAWTNAFRQSELINNGKAFKYAFNHEHNLRSNLSFKFKRTSIGKVVAIGLSWFYGSGLYTTFPLHYSPQLDIPSSSQTMPLPFGRNELKLPSYHHLDFVISTIKETDKGVRTLSFSFFNVYMTEIPFYYIWSTSGSFSGSKATLRMEGMVPILPSVIYKYRWK